MNRAWTVPIGAGRGKRWALPAIVALCLLGAMPKSVFAQDQAPPIRLDVAANPSGKPLKSDVAVDMAGSAHVVWRVPHASSDRVVYCRIPRGARACDRRATLSGAIGCCSVDGPEVALSPLDDVYVVDSRAGNSAFQNDVNVWESTNGGASFTGPRNAGTLAMDRAFFGPGEFGLSLVDGQNGGTVYQAVTTVQGEPRATGKAQIGNTGGGIAEGAYSGSVAFPEPNTPVAAFSDLDNVYWREFKGTQGGFNDIANWGPPNVLSPGTAVDLGTSAKGTFALYQKPDGSWALKRFDRVKRTFGTEIPFPDARPLFPRLATAAPGLEVPGGSLVVAYTTCCGFPGNPPRIVASRDGSTFGIPIEYKSAPPPGSDLEFAVAPDGAGMMVYQDSVGLIAQPTDAPPEVPPAGGDPPAGGGDPFCPEQIKVGQAYFRAAFGCFEAVKKDVFETKGIVRMNGIDLIPIETGAAQSKPVTFVLDKAKGVLAANFKTEVRAGEVILEREKLKWGVDGSQLFDLTKGGNGAPLTFDPNRIGTRLLGFRVEGIVKPRLLPKAAARLPINLPLPAPLDGPIGGPVSGDFGLSTSNLRVGGLDLSPGNVSLKLREVSLGIAQLKPFEITYRADPNIFDGDIGILMPLIPSKVTAAFRVQNGDFAYGRLFLEDTTQIFPPQGIPLVPPYAHITGIGFEVEKSQSCANPTRFALLATITGGPKVGPAALVEVDGKGTFKFPRNSDGCSSPPQIEIDGSGKVAGIPFFSLNFKANTHGLFAVAGDFNLADVVRANAAGGLHLGTGEWFIKGTAQVGTDFFTVANVALIGSNLGVGACAKLLPIISDFLPLEAGAAFWFHTTPSHDYGLDIMIGNCDVSELQPAVFASASQGGPAHLFQVKGRPRFAVARVRGRSVPPGVRLVAPDGRTYEIPQVPGAKLGHPTKHADGIVAIRVPQQRALDIRIPSPRAGRWRIVPLAGEIDRVLSASALPKPRVRAKIRRRGRRLVIRYRLKPLSGQQVRFVERDRAGRITPMGTAKGRGGRLRTPLTGSRGRRRVSAMVLQNGLLRKEVRVGSYLNPGPARPGPVRRLRVRRRGTTATVSWRRARNARRYVVRLIASDGRRSLIFTRRRRVKLRNLTRIDSGRVLVASQDRIGNTGRVSRARIRRQRKPFCKKKGKGVSNRPPVCRRRAARRRR